VSSSRVIVDTYTAEEQTLVYPVDGGLVQTTLAFWQRVLSQCHAALATATTPEVGTVGSY
jgi:hypothetical protein